MKKLEVRKKKTRKYVRKGKGWLEIAFDLLDGEFSIGHINNVDKGKRTNYKIEKAITKAQAQKAIIYGS